MERKTMMRMLMVFLAFAALAGAVYASGVFSESTLDAMGRVALGLSMIGIVAFGFRQKERAAQGRLSFSGHLPKEGISAITFDKVAANEEAKRSLEDLVDFLKQPEKYARLGARMPRGVLLYGPPGTGKTLLARALSGEAGVPFYALSGSDFVQMYVGVGAGRVRELFQKARKAGKCVIFIDEIDAMGKKREGSGSEERDQTLNALLSEMSGFRPDEGIIVLAATNRMDVLDPALLRPGRFDRHIEVGLPDAAQRLRILELHSGNKPLDAQVDLARLAADTARFSGASLESLLNEAAIYAARRGSEMIENRDISDAFVSVVAGEDRENPRRLHKEKMTVALHEAGHALASRLLLPDHRITRVSILPSTRGAAGYNLSVPPDLMLHSKTQIQAQVMVLLAGRAAEELIAGEEEITSGAVNDLSRAAELTAAMVMDLGMADAPYLALRPLSRACGGQGGGGMKQCTQALEDMYRQVYDLLSDNVEKLMRITRLLAERDAISQVQLDEAIAA